MISFSREQRMVHHLMLHSRDCSDYGLFTGRLGIALVLEEYAVQHRSKPIRHLAEALAAEVFDHLDEDMPTGLATGLCGIGWGIEYMIHRGYMKGDSLDICEVIDRKLMTENLLYIDDLSLERGLEGKLHYILAHIQNTKGKGMPFHANFINMVNAKIDDCINSRMALSENMKTLANIFHKMYHSENWGYTFCLSDFINVKAKDNYDFVDLNNGLAGYIKLNYVA